MSWTMADLFVLARRLLKSLSVKQGIKYDSPESARDIPTFIEFHKLKVDEILKPVEAFSTSCTFPFLQHLLTVPNRDLQRILLPRAQA